VDYRGFYEWEKLIFINYEIIFSLPTSAQTNRVAVDEMPEHLNWIAMVDRLANGDITKYEAIYNLSYAECLTTMAYWHHRDKYNNNINKKMNK